MGEVAIANVLWSQLSNEAGAFRAGRNWLWAKARMSWYTKGKRVKDLNVYAILMQVVS